MRVLICGIHESAQSRECSLGFAQMMLDLPFGLPGVSNVHLEFAASTADAARLLDRFPGVDVLACIPVFKSNIQFVRSAVQQTDKALVLGAVPQGRVDWQRVQRGEPAYGFDERFLGRTRPETFDGTYVRVDATLEEAMRESDCFVAHLRDDPARQGVWVDVKNVMNCALHFDFVGSVLPRVLSTASR